MTRISMKAVKNAAINRDLVHGTETIKKAAQLSVLRDHYEETGDQSVGKILNTLAQCGNPFRCNSRHCPKCSNPRTSRSKRRKAEALKTNLGSVAVTTTDAKSNEYRVRGGQRMVAVFEDVPLCMCHCMTVNLGLVPVEGDLDTEQKRYRKRLRKVLGKLTFGAIARGKFDIVLKYADDLAFDLPDDDLPNGITNADLPHTRFAMLHIHFIVFDPWLSRREVRQLFADEFPGASRICARQTRKHVELANGTIVGGAQGYLEYASMEKIEIDFGDEARDALIEYVTLSQTWTRHNQNFSFGKSIDVSDVVIDPERAKALQRENRLDWVRKNWSKLCYAEQFIHVWISGSGVIALGVRELPDYREKFKERFIEVFSLYCNWVKSSIFDLIDFKRYLEMAKAKLSQIPMLRRKSSPQS